MALEFVFFPFTPKSWILLASTIIINVFIVLGAVKMNKDKREYQSSYIAIVLSSLILIFSFVKIFLPDERIVGEWTWEQLQDGFSYDFTISVTLPKSIMVCFAIALIIIGVKNKEKKTYLELVGLFLLIASLLSLYNNGRLYYVAWFSSQDLAYLSPKYLTFEIVNIAILCLGFLTLAIVSFRMENYYFGVYGILSLVLHIYLILDSVVF